VVLKLFGFTDQFLPKNSLRIKIAYFLLELWINVMDVQLCPNSFAFMNPKLMRKEQVLKGLLTH
jgi:hypothetical protein